MHGPRRSAKNDEQVVNEPSVCLRLPNVAVQLFIDIIVRKLRQCRRGLLPSRPPPTGWTLPFVCSEEEGVLSSWKSEPRETQ
jgi:hypothetical protein